MRMDARLRKHIVSLCKEHSWLFYGDFHLLGASESLLELSSEVTFPLAGGYLCHSYRSKYQ